MRSGYAEWKAKVMMVRMSVCVAKRGGQNSICHMVL